MNQYLMPNLVETFSHDLNREDGSMPLCHVKAIADTYYPVTVHLGGAVMVLSKRDALSIAHTLVNAVLSLPRSI